MSGIKYLLDTNFILGILKGDQDALDAVHSRDIRVSECAFSTISRMELLGFHGITEEEEALVEDKLARLTHLTSTDSVVARVIQLRQTRKIKLPDAIIASTALIAGVELLTMDKQLLSVMGSSGT